MLITPSLPPARCGGAEYALRLSRELADAGVVPTILTARGSAVTDQRISVLPVADHWQWPELIRIVSAVDTIKPDVVDIHFTGWSFGDEPMITMLPTFLKRAHGGIRIVTHLESLGGVAHANIDLSGRFLRWLASMVVGRRQINYEYGSLFRDSDEIIFLNNRDKEEIGRSFPNVLQKCRVIPPPAIMPILPPYSKTERARLRQELNFDTDTTVIAFYGFVYPGKGLESLLSAVSIMSEQARVNGSGNIHLLVIGGTPESYVFERAQRASYMSELEELARNLSISSSLTWTGYIESDSPKASHYLRLADLCVLPFDDGVMLHNSSFSYAAAHGIPIVTTSGAHTESRFAHGDTAWLVPAGDSQALARAMSKVAADPVIREKLSQGALRLTEEEFNWKQAVARIIEAYRGYSLAASPAAPAGLAAEPLKPG